jgi:hypothetical protein
MRFKKTDIETHSDNGYGAGYPAICVKVYHVDCDTSDVIATCTEALEFAFISECESFWQTRPATRSTHTSPASILLDVREAGS